jgi:hypothetical protein
MRFYRALIPALFFWAFSFAAYAQPAPQSDSDKAPTILACFNAGQTAIRDLHACAQAWLTPKALLLCALQNAEAGKAGPIACPFLPDTPGGRAILDALLAQQHLTRDSNLSLDSRNFPGLPSAVVVDACNKTASTPQDFLACIQSSTSEAKTLALLQCIETSESDTGRALCLAKSATGDPALSAAVKCLAVQGAAPDQFISCFGKPDQVAAAKTAMGCAARAGSSAAALADCLLPSASPAQKALAACLAQSQDDDRTVAGCLGNFLPAMGRAEQASACFSDPGNSAAKCAGVLLGDTTHVSETVAACTGVRRNAQVACLLDKRPELVATQRLYGCFANGGEGSSLVATCTGDLVPDEKIRRTLTCITAANNDPAALAVCAAGSVLPHDAAHLAECAAASDGSPASFALCAAAPKTDDDWRISAQCAIASAGDSKAYAGCMGEPLAIGELGKCFKGKFGKDCFGPTNSIAKTLNIAQ